MSDLQPKEWYKSWFNTPYYHLLYQNRDWQEAQMFIDQLMRVVNLPHGSEILDVACGRGRHALHMKTFGYKVQGIDLSEANIAYAKQLEDEQLHFSVFDMRETFSPNRFDLVTNLFTSFGYFEDEADHQRTIHAFAASLKTGGFLVMDFLNAELVAKRLVQEEESVLENAHFQIKRYIAEDFVHKQITLRDEHGEHSFRERVKLLKLNNFETFFKKANLELLQCYGNYQLNQAFNPASSERLILLAKKL
ncbi:MAG: class I SAM-dependent methyltransferase [Cytophagales bacterium]|nr:MAG: class I SAM-dependent methyltransferase [Cytophagales bacterium]